MSYSLQCHSEAETLGFRYTGQLSFPREMLNMFRTAHLRAIPLILSASPHRSSTLPVIFILPCRSSRCRHLLAFPCQNYGAEFFLKSWYLKVLRFSRRWLLRCGLLGVWLLWAFWRNPYSTMRMEAALSSETLVSSYESEECQNAKDKILKAA